MRCHKGRTDLNVVLADMIASSKWFGLEELRSKLVWYSSSVSW